jgi:hypothetical protein
MTEGRGRKFLRKPISLILVGVVLGLVLAPVAADAALTINSLWKKLMPKMDARYVQLSSPAPVGPGKIYIPLLDQKLVVANDWCAGWCLTGDGGYGNENWVRLGSETYPAGASFHLEAVFRAPDPTATPGEERTLCMRLFDSTSNAGVAGSETCHVWPAGDSGDGPNGGWVVGSEFNLPASEHDYTLNVKASTNVVSSTFGAQTNHIRLVVQW